MWTCSFPRRCGRWNCSGAVPCTHLRQISSSSIPAGMQLHYCCYTASHKYFGATGSLKNAMSTEIGCSLVIRMFIWWSCTVSLIGSYLKHAVFLELVTLLLKQQRALQCILHELLLTVQPFLSKSFSPYDLWSR